MNCKNIQPMISLSLDGELAPQKQLLLDRHLATCDRCTTELKRLVSFRACVATLRSTSTEERDLFEARKTLYRNFEGFATPSRSSGLLHGSFWDAIVPRLQGAFSPLVKLSAVGLAMLVVGIAAGLFLFRPTYSSDRSILPGISEATEVKPGQPWIADLKFRDANPSDGLVAFTFNTVIPVRVKGSPNDPGVQSVLARALLDEENPGARLKAVSALTPPIQIQSSTAEADTDIEHALIQAMIHDENAGVRRGALLALKRFPFDNEIKRGFLTVLSTDTNEGLRAEAIDGLAAGGILHSDGQLLNVLRTKSTSDNNPYVRQCARQILEEVK